MYSTCIMYIMDAISDRIVVGNEIGEVLGATCMAYMGD